MQEIMNTDYLFDDRIQMQKKMNTRYLFDDSFQMQETYQLEEGSPCSGVPVNNADLFDDSIQTQEIRLDEDSTGSGVPVNKADLFDDSIQTQDIRLDEDSTGSGVPVNTAYLFDDSIGQIEEIERVEEVSKNGGIRRATPGKRFECSVCNVMWPSPSARDAHMRTHTRDKPFQCTVCCQRFAQVANLRTHFSAIHEDGKLECHICKKMLSSQANLSTHIYKTHDITSRVYCVGCDTWMRGDLARHLKRPIHRRKMLKLKLQAAVTAEPAATNLTGGRVSMDRVPSAPKSFDGSSPLVSMDQVRRVFLVVGRLVMCV